jgi:uncharacterized protein (TIGR00251 family)
MLPIARTARDGTDRRDGRVGLTGSRRRGADIARMVAVLHPTADGVVIDVHVQPGGSRDEIVGRHGDALKVKVSAPPEGGKANKAVCRLLADAFGVPRSAVEVVSGATSRRKRIRLAGVSVDAAEARLERLLA